MIIYQIKHLIVMKFIILKKKNLIRHQKIEKKKEKKEFKIQKITLLLLQKKNIKIYLIKIIGENTENIISEKLHNIKNI